MSSPPQLDVIAVGAHPDDVEIACGGILAQLARQGQCVGIIDLTDGEPTPLSPGPEVRLAEAKDAAAVLGVQHRVTLELPNRRLFDSFEARTLLATELRRYRPRLVIGLGASTPTASPDHWQAMQITDAAVFYAKLTKWDEHFDGLPPLIIPALLHCYLIDQEEILSRPGRIITDISDTLQLKLAAIRCYKTQFPPEKEHVFQRVEATARFLGQASRVEAAELLTSPRPVPIPDLMGFLFGNR
jgi:LmbE family N-acetylglucosaminyl deacetylase